MFKFVINKIIDQGIGYVVEEVIVQKYGCEYVQVGLQVQVGGGLGCVYYQDDQIGEVVDVRYCCGYQEYQCDLLGMVKVFFVWNYGVFG